MPSGRATFELLGELHRAYGPAAPRACVDDMAMMLVELTQSALLGTLRPAVFRFVEELGRLGLRISTKSTLCPTTSSAVRALQAALLKQGVATSLADGGRDLGGGVQAAWRRTKAVALRRLTAARQRA